MSSIERVTYRPEGARARTMYLSDVRDITVAGEPALVGAEVDKDGSPVLPMGKDGESRRLHIVQLALVVRRTPVVMDNIYGEFVEA